jgi:iron complex transport system substrate-binding protein
MKRFSLVLICVTILSLLLGACAPAALASLAKPTTISVTDGLNRPVNLTSAAQRIVSLAPSNTEILFAIGAGSQVVGRDEFSDFPAEAKQLPSVGGSMGKYNFEEIAKLKPDLVLAAAINTPEQVKSLQDLGLTVYYLNNPKDLNGMFTNLEILAQLTGREKETTQLISSLKARVDAVTQEITTTSSHPKAFYELDATDPTKPWTAGAGAYIDQLITAAGGINVASALNSSYAQMSQEDLLVKNPDMIFLGDGAYGVTADQVTKRPGWDVIQAVKDQKIYTFDDNLVSRPGPRMVDGLETLAKLLHPELFK